MHTTRYSSRWAEVCRRFGGGAAGDGGPGLEGLRRDPTGQDSKVFIEVPPGSRAKLNVSKSGARGESKPPARRRRRIGNTDAVDLDEDDDDNDEGDEGDEDDEDDEDDDGQD
ncbi:hypothetical protein [Streptomyces sp. NPDC058371]|uniref:hypothetical protein n=1 Tax=Streptomyces sp. NPDC058371 TaxID=3346463 RepID=UPI0036510FEC